jgi:hypothetical protein
MSCTIVELDDIDEALSHLALVPEPKRDDAWRYYVDKVLDLRNILEPR